MCGPHSLVRFGDLGLKQAELPNPVIKLVSILFGKCTTLVIMKCWPMVTGLPCGDQWKAEKLGAF